MLEQPFGRPRETAPPPLTYPGTDVTVESASGPLKGRLSQTPSVTQKHAVIICPGLAVGMDGDFVRQIEREILSGNLAQWSLRFNFFGHTQDNLNADITGFTFPRAVNDFNAGVKLLREQGAERITAVCSSTGTQVAILSACGDSPGVDHIIGRSAVVDCFRSVLAAVPPAQLQIWKDAGKFTFPVGGQAVTMGSDFILDLEHWRANYDLSRLRVPLTLVHGERDQTVPLAVVKQSLAAAPQDLVKLSVIPAAGHDLSVDGKDSSKPFILSALAAAGSRGAL